MADTMEDLKARLQEAALEGNTDEILRLAKEVAKIEAVEKTAQAVALQAQRSKVTEGIVKAVRPVLEKFAGAELDALGGVIRITYQPSANELLTVAIASTAPAKVASGTISAPGDGKPGKLRGMYGKTLAEMFTEVATPDEQASYAEKVGNSAQYAYKNRIVQAAIDAGRFTPIS
jgi:hypothetical protein